MPSEPSTSFRQRQLPDDQEVYCFAPLDKIPGVAHAYTTRNGPLFPAEADVGAAMYKHLAVKLGCRDVAWCRQVHGDVVLPIRRGGCAGEADGLVTDQPGLAVLGRSADCALILAVDIGGRVVGMAHASWRSTIKRIAVHLIEILQKDFGVDPANVIACVGPSAGPDQYEVGRDVYDAAVEHLGPDAKHFFIKTNQPDKWHMDLWSANAAQLMQAGVAFMNLYTARVCTIERNDLFPSRRVEGAKAQRFAAIIGLRNT
ncbi:MAG: polyphenol oxidase family protein [Deltaproteobacteria bacterium]|nr:polyphenol oxidase family protein [Deltaproteobacteria bacterium]